MNEPDLVLFVGEALVGNEAVDQLVKFNQALADYSASDNPHTIDGIVLTKFDTIDDKVKRLVLFSLTMVYYIWFFVIRLVLPYQWLTLPDNQSYLLERAKHMPTWRLLMSKQS